MLDSGKQCWTVSDEEFPEDANFVPVGQELGSGENVPVIFFFSPVTLALHWCHCSVREPIDIVSSSHQDLFTKVTQVRVEKDADQVEAWWAAINCVSSIRAA